MRIKKRGSDNKKTPRKDDMIKVYDNKRKKFITPAVIDMDYVPTYDRADDKVDNEEISTTYMSDLESEEFVYKKEIKGDKD